MSVCLAKGKEKAGLGKWGFSHLKGRGGTHKFTGPLWLVFDGHLLPEELQEQRRAYAEPKACGQCSSIPEKPSYVLKWKVGKTPWLH